MSGLVPVVAFERQLSSSDGGAMGGSSAQI